MKKVMILLLFMVIGLSGCKPVVEEVDCELYPTHVDCLVDDDPVVDDDDDDDVIVDVNFLDIYYLNDFHGAILDASDQIGFSGIASFIQNKKETYPNNVIVLAGGDMLQGSALSNYYNGLSTIDIMDEIGFDAMTLGNHEFDWGLDVVLNYFDEDDSNGEADFPLLGANVFYEGTTTIPEYIDPYTIIEKGDMKIGIIGTMGMNLEYSIATSRIDGYEFTYPVDIIGGYAEELRTEHNVDFVIWVGHDSGDYNSEIADLTGNQKIDAMFNAHSHAEYTSMSYGIPVLQAGSNGEFVGHVRINFDEDKIITSYDLDNISMYESAYFFQDDPEVQALIDGYLDETDVLFNTPIITSGASYNTTQLSNWLSKLMRINTGSDIAFHNYGGTRTDVDQNEVITLGVLYQIWPFDNVIKTVYLDGSTVNSLKSAGMAYDTEIETFEEGTLYKVATNDYVFDKETNPFIYGTDIDNTGIVLRDLVEDELQLQALLYSTFTVDNVIQSIYE
jgi:2',3'-cyclic-nucleotide 2'-phosphodiesterase (5'-nucleotidase family)